jgi:hypothetical protein
MLSDYCTQPIFAVSRVAELGAPTESAAHTLALRWITIQAIMAAVDRLPSSPAPMWDAVSNHQRRALAGWLAHDAFCLETQRYAYLVKCSKCDKHFVAIFVGRNTHGSAPHEKCRGNTSPIDICNNRDAMASKTRVVVLELPVGLRRELLFKWLVQACALRQPLLKGRREMPRPAFDDEQRRLATERFPRHVTCVDA